MNANLKLLERLAAAEAEVPDSLQWPRDDTHFKPWWDLYDKALAYFREHQLQPSTSWEIASVSSKDAFLTEITALESLIVVSGGLNPENGVFGDGHVVQTLMDAVKRGKSVEIAFGLPIIVREDGTHALADLLVAYGEEKYPKNLRMFCTGMVRPPLHFCAIGLRKLSFEYPHNEWSAARRRVRVEGSEGALGPLVKQLFLSSTKGSTPLRTRADFRATYLKPGNRTTVREERVRYLRESAAASAEPETGST